MKITKKTSRKEFAAIVVHQLERHGISCVLVGGACVSIYTDEKHASKDLDFISPNAHTDIEDALAEAGFTKQGKYFKHSNSDFFVEFPSGPVAIGNQIPVKPEGRLKVRNTVITLYSPTQCVMDRLAAFFHWDDRRSFIHALWICEKHPVNISKIRKWAEKEKSKEKLEEFLEQYKKAVNKTKQPK